MISKTRWMLAVSDKESILRKDIQETFVTLIKNLSGRSIIAPMSGLRHESIFAASQFYLAQTYVLF